MPSNDTCAEISDFQETSNQRRVSTLLPLLSAFLSLSKAKTQFDYRQGQDSVLFSRTPRPAVVPE
jgi:hypothetical protein